MLSQACQLLGKQVHHRLGTKTHDDVIHAADVRFNIGERMGYLKIDQNHSSLCACAGKGANPHLMKPILHQFKLLYDTVIKPSVPKTLKSTHALFAFHDFQAFENPLNRERENSAITVVAARQMREQAVALPTFQYNASGWNFEPIVAHDAPVWQTRNSRLVWRGNVDGTKEMHRKELVKLSGRFPDHIDARHATSETYMSREQQQHFKYTMYTPGLFNAYSWRLPSLLLDEYVVLIPVPLRYEPWFMPALKPYVHFVPVKAGNIVEAIDWLRKNDHAAHRIAIASRNLMLKLQTTECMRSVWHHFWHHRRGSDTQKTWKCPSKCELHSL